MTKQRQFTDAFKAEAVGLVRTSGRTKRQVVGFAMGERMTRTLVMDALRMAR